jgi:CheY-like chemotaxis protein
MMQHQRDTIHFLLIEDDRNDAFSVERALDCAPVDCTVYIAHDGQEAIDYLLGRDKYLDRKKYPLPSVVLLDLKLPRVDGFEFMSWLRNDSPGDLHVLPVIVITASSEQDDIDRCYALGVNSYVVKTHDPKRFAANVRAVKEFWTLHARTPAVSQRFSQ